MGNSYMTDNILMRGNKMMGNSWYVLMGEGYSTTALGSKMKGNSWLYIDGR